VKKKPTHPKVRVKATTPGRANKKKRRPPTSVTAASELYKVKKRRTKGE